MAPYRTPSALVGPPCPRFAGVTLRARPLAGTNVDECARCGGVFVATAVVARIARDLTLRAAVNDTYESGPLQEPLTVNALRCPRCRIGMKRQRFSESAEVVVDVCGPHGTWFDARELPAVVALVGKQRAEWRKRKPEPEPVAEPTAEDGGGLLGAIGELIDWWL